ncbi:MAG: group 1 truncated hemoglobin [Xanthomonadales bacterium]|nr:group 1 truncated hemoglobin [Xanthomonadales bacterium]
MAALALATALAGGCAHQPAPPRSDALYHDLGGDAGITAIVEGLLYKMVDDPRIAHHFADADIINLRQRLIEQICFESGGPCVYEGLDMQESHAGRNISEAEFNALVEDLIDVMEERSVDVGAQNRLLRRLAPMQPDIVRQ